MSGTLAIPASAVANVIPSVVSAGGTALDLNGLLLTTNPRVPIGTVRTFSSQADIAAFFGASSQEAALAGTYFLGYDNSTQKPGAVLFAQYNTAPVGAWLRGGSLSGMTLAQLQALSGTVIVTIDGTLRTSSPINLSSATSFSSAAELITVGLGQVGPAEASFTGAISGTTLTVSAVSSGTLAVGQEVRGAGVTAGTQIAAFGTGSGGTGTYTLTVSQTVSSTALTSNTPTVTYDSVAQAFVVVSATTGAGSTIGYASGTLSGGIKLTQAAGAATSQGAATAVPATFMANVMVQTQNWACFATTFDPDGGSGSTQKQAFAAWVNSILDRFVYVAWDTDAAPSLSNAATTSFGNIVQAANSNGVVAIYSPVQGPALAAFFMGAVAAIDFGATNGRISLAFKSQTGIVPDVTNQTVADNLIANGYNFYGAYATANDGFNFFYPGQISGPFEWADSYINQIWLNNQFQLAMLVLLTNARSIPYAASGYAMIRAALKDPIDQAANFGAFRAGVTLSETQKVLVNNAAGQKIDDILTQQGWYLQVKDASPQVRAARGSPPCSFWYTDGQSVHKITLASIEVQ